MDDTELTRGQRLTACRKSIGWSQDDVARYLQIGQGTVSRAEDDFPKLSNVMWIAFADFIAKVEAKTIRAEDKPKIKTEGKSHEQ